MKIFLPHTAAHRARTFMSLANSTRRPRAPACPLSAVCAPGYARSSRSEPCQQCGSPAEAWGSTVLSTVVLLALLLILLVINRKAPASALRPLVNFGQTLSIMLLFSAPWPEVVVTIGR